MKFMEKRILWINPMRTNNEFNRKILDYINNVKEEDTYVDVVSLNKGPEFLNYHYLEALVLLEILNLVRMAEKENYDGVVIGCFFDSGLRQAREIAKDITVVVPCEASVLIAAGLGYRFSIIVNQRKSIPKMHENVSNYGIAGCLASFESIELDISEIHKDRKETEKRMFDAAMRAVNEKLAEVIILGCTVHYGIYKELQKKLKVPVIDPIVASIKHAEFMIKIRKSLNWGYSKINDCKSPLVTNMNK